MWGHSHCFCDQPVLAKLVLQHGPVGCTTGVISALAVWGLKAMDSLLELWGPPMKAKCSGRT